MENRTKKDIISGIAENLSIDREDAASVINEFAFQLHKRLYEYSGLNGDYLGEELHYHVDKQAFFHILGFLDCFSERYSWDPGDSSEYLLRLGTIADWLPYSHQTEAWKAQSR